MNMIINFDENGKLQIKESDGKKRVVREFKGKSLIDFQDSYVVVDIETTGLDPKYDSIIEIGAIKYIDGQAKETFSELIKPSTYYILDEEDIDEINDYCVVDGTPIQYVDSYITELTGITNKMLENACCEDEVLKRFKIFAEDFVIVGHNVNFDINFLYDASMSNFNEPLKNDFIDTMRIARKILKDLPHHRLSDLAKYYKITIEVAHRALEDCYITASILENLKDEAVNQFGSIEKYIESYKKSSSISAKDIVAQKSEFDETHPLYGQICVFTGTLEKMQRKDAMQIVANLGGINGNSVTAKTNYLILGNNDYCPLIKGGKSNKQKKAEELKLKGKAIEIITENVFYDMIEQ